YSFAEGTGPDMYFCVKLGTDYKDGKYEGLEIKPLELKIKVPKGESETTETTQATTETTTETTETTTKTTETTVKEPTEVTLRGDVNNSGKVDVSDAVLLARLLAEDSGADVSAQGKLNADADKSGELDGDDVILILQHIAKIIQLV
ncbi:MAG: dockerin type I repeat-containing protein, partial [Oscillospiraceae bacterium]|nr:dockerin type I repeat-containing protein [Oscillospiraceae bacterium]